MMSKTQDLQMLEEIVGKGKQKTRGKATKCWFIAVANHFVKKNDK